MVDLRTTYMGMILRTPLVPSASPLTDDVTTIIRLAEAGASAIVLRSLFEEQLTHERHELHHHLTFGTESFSEAQSFFPEPELFRADAEHYLELIQEAKSAVDIPIIASLNGKSVGGWTNYAQELEKAGADGLELNIYHIPTSMDISGADIESRYLSILQEVKATVNIPVALKLSPFFSNMAAMAQSFDQSGANALVLFNRFYQPDIDLESLEITPNLLLSSPHEMRLPLTWIGILFGHLKADLAATTGIHQAEDVIKMIMVGANITMLCSTLLRNGISHLTEIEKQILHWMEEHEYESIEQMRGSMSQLHCEDPTAFERAQYMKTLNSYQSAMV